MPVANQAVAVVTLAGVFVAAWLVVVDLSTVHVAAFVVGGWLAAHHARWRCLALCGHKYIDR
jgi:hypothetical protein